MTDEKNEKCDFEKSEEVTRGEAEEMWKDEALKTAEDEAEEIKKEARETLSQDEGASGADFQSEDEVTGGANYKNVDEVTSEADCQTEDSESLAGRVAEEPYPTDVQSESDLAQLRNTLPELKDLADVSDLKYPEEYAHFRALGLTPREAYLATGERREPIEARRITSPMSVKRTRDAIPEYYLKMAREIFGGLSDREIQSLYSRVSRRQ